VEGLAPLSGALAGVLCISFSGILVRLSDVPPVLSALWRTLFASAFLLALSGLRRERGSDLLAPLPLLAGALLGADLLAWHGSIIRIGAGLATVLPNLQVIGVGLLSMLLFGERPGRLFWLGLPPVLGGVWILGATGVPVAPDASVAWGVALGLITAAFYTGYLLILRQARLGRPERSTLATVTALTLGATVVTACGALVDRDLSLPPSWAAAGWLALLGVGVHSLGWLLLTASIHRIPAALTSVTLLLQPLLALGWGVVFLAEPVGLVQGLGALLLLAGVGLAQRGAARAAATPATSVASVASVASPATPGGDRRSP
jgi:drug/metabolite transporter (DMT)-like permease